MDDRFVLLIVLYQVSCSRPFIKDLDPERVAVTEYRLSLEAKENALVM